MEALGRLFDLSCGWAPANLQGGITGNRVHLKNCGGVTIVVFKAAGTDGDDPTFDVRQHDAYTGGNSADLDVVSHYYLKAEVTMEGDETWSVYTQTAASEIVDPGGATTSAQEQQILVIEIEASSLSDGYEWVSLDAADPANANAQYGACLYILRDLHVKRNPVNLASPLA